MVASVPVPPYTLGDFVIALYAIVMQTKLIKQPILILSSKKE